MIHLGYTPATVPAVMGSRRLRCRTLLAPFALGFDHTPREDITTWVHGYSLVVGVPEAEQQSVEDDGLCLSRRPGVEVQEVEDKLGEVGQEGNQEADGRHSKALNNRCIAESRHGDGMAIGWATTAISRHSHPR